MDIRVFLGSDRRSQNFKNTPKVHNVIDFARKKGLPIPEDSAKYKIIGMRTGTTYKLDEDILMGEDLKIILK